MKSATDQLSTNIRDSELFYSKCLVLIENHTYFFFSINLVVYFIKNLVVSVLIDIFVRKGHKKSGILVLSKIPLCFTLLS